MSSIDERIVDMKFNNGQFQSGIQGTLASLDALKKGLNLGDAAKSLGNLDAAGRRVSMAHIGQGVDALVSKFKAMSVVGITALATIANKAVNAGIQMAKSLTVDPIKAGLAEYETNLNSIQTILANTGLEGQAGLNKVNAALEELNTYSDDTIYNFSEMARNIGTFTAAGVKLEPATNAIKGIANLAALSGSNAQQASTAMYQLSQAMAAGKVSLMDWNSVVNAGMGGKVFQNALMETARVSGVAVDKIIKKSGSFRDSLKEGWLTTDILTKTLSQFTGDMTDAQLKSMGYSKQQIAEIQKLAKVARGAATEVKTVSQLFGSLQEAAGSGWAKTWQLIIGDFGEAKTLWTDVNNVIGGFIGASADARNKVIGDWKALGGRTALIEAIKNAWGALVSVVKPIKDAFREIFPATTGKQLYNMTVAVRDFMKTLQLSGENGQRLKTTFKGIFAIFSIGWTILKGVIGLFFDMFGLFTGAGPGGILATTSSFAELIIAVQEFLVQGGKIQWFFDKISQARAEVLQPILAFFGKLGEAIGFLFRGDRVAFFDSLGEAFSFLSPLIDVVRNRINMVLGVISMLSSEGAEFLEKWGSAAWAPIIGFLEKVQSGIDVLREKLGFLTEIEFKLPTFGGGGGGTGMSAVIDEISIFDKIGAMAHNTWAGLMEALIGVKNLIGPIITSIGDLIETVIDKITEYIGGLNMGDAVSLLNTGFFIAMYVAIRKFMGDLSGLLDNFTGMFDSVSGAFDSIGGTFNQLTESLKTMQQNVQANIILKIAAAVALLVASIYTMSKIPAEDLKKALGGVAALLTMLLLTLKAFDKFNLVDQSGILQTGASLVLLAIAIKILASAVKDLSGFDWQELAKGLVGVGGLLASLALFTKYAEANKGGIAQSAGLILLAFAIKLLVSSVATLGNMDVPTLIKGITALGFIFAGLAAMTKVMNNTKGIVKAAAGLLILSVAMAALSVVLRIYAAMDWSTILKGLGAVVLAVAGIGGAMRAMPDGKKAGSLIVAAGALAVLAGVIKVLGGMSLGDLAKGVITIGLSLAMLAIALNAMTTALPGAQALLVASAALAIFAVTMKILATISWEGIAVGLVAIAGLLTILGIAGLVMGPVLPVLLGLAIILKMLGLAMLVAGAGFLMFAAGFAVLASVGAAGFAVLIAGFMGILNLLPLFAQQLGHALIAFALVISNAGPVWVKAMTTILMALLNAIDIIMPKFFDTMTRLILGLLNVIVRLAPRIYRAGFDLMIGFGKVLRDKVPEIVKVAVDLMIAFIKAITDEVPRLVDEGYKMIIKFINELADTIEENSEELGRSGGRLATALITGMVKGINAGVGEVVRAAKGMAGSVLKGIAGIFDSHSPSRETEKLGKYADQGLAIGLIKNGYVARRAGEKVAKDTLDTMTRTIKGLIGVVQSDMKLDGPTITPILDLDPMRKDVAKIGKIVSAQDFALGATYLNASRAARSIAEGRAATKPIEAGEASTRDINFEQHIHSPKPVSQAETYRSTRNLLSIAKEELANAGKG